MIRIKYVIAIFSIVLISTCAFSQKVAIIGMNHNSSSPNTDGFSFVALEELPNGEIIYFTENLYDANANVFSYGGAPSGQGVVKFTATTVIPIGTVIFVNETGTTTNTFTVSCCGTAQIAPVINPGNGPFSINSGGDRLYAYSDNNDNVTDAIGEIYSVMYTLPGFIPTTENPTSHPNSSDAIVVDGFSISPPDRTEYKFNPASLRDGVSKTGLENPINYLNGEPNAALSTVTFTNLNLSGSNPVLSITRLPASLNENSGSSFSYTFNLSSNATSNLTVNFSVNGTATFNSDYTVANASSFNAGAGTVIINSGTNSKTITINPIADSLLEPNETITLTLNAGTGYDAGSPSSATATILNDDTLNVTPLVAVTGGVHTLGQVEGFSFVALDDISAGTEIFLTENVFDNNLLRFTGAEAVVRWIAPAGGILRGEVIVATEGPANVFTTTCNSGNCGTVSLISGNFDYASNGEALFAYTDTDTDHTNGITAISAVLFTGTSTAPGGNIPVGEDPSGVYIGSVVVDGFPALPPVRTEYKFASGERSVTVDQANFQNTSNWLHAAAVGTLDSTPFANIIISTGSVNPSLTLSITPSTTVEDSGTGMVYTFLLNANAVGDIAVNFTVGGTATFITDYTQTGAATFDASSGTAVILDGTNSVDVTITPVVDSTVEPIETIELMIASGTGYDGGSQNSATGSITNDDTSMSDPLVAITGMNHISPDGFSFVAAKDIPANSLIYFTENAFDNTTLLFGTGEGVMAYTSPGVVIPVGDVIVIKETAPDVFSLTCNGSTGADCGSIALISNNLAHDSLGETLYAYEDSDNDPSNGVDDIYAVMFTGLSSQSGGNIPASQDPSGIYLSALVIDGFPASAPDRTEYKFANGEREILVDQANFEDTANNWLHGQSNADLSPIPFENINIVDVVPPVITCPADTIVECGGDTSPVGTESAIATDDVDPTPTITFTDSSVPSCGNTEVITRTWTATDDAGNSASCSQLITVIDNTAPTILCPADVIVECGDDTSPSSTGTATGSDGCGTVAITFSDTSVASCGLTETITRTWTSTDQCGNSASCIQIIIVMDTTNPVITCPANVTVECGDDTSPAATGEATAIDACGTVEISFVDSSVSKCGNTETITRTWTATDECGKVASCEQIITVEDTKKPTISCTPNISVNNQTGSCGAVVNYSAPAGSDTCGTANTVQIAGLGSGATFPVGITTETYEVTDACGNTQTCSFTVTVNDSDAPIILCLGDIEVNNDPGECGAIVTYSPPVGTDNCPAASTVQTEGLGSGAFFPVGVTTETYVVTDASGKTNSCSFTVTVRDNEPPVLTCLETYTLELNANGEGSFNVFSAGILLNQSDNCGTVGGVGVSGPSIYTCDDLGIHTVFITQDDAAGNEIRCSFTLTVTDPLSTCNQPPVASCKDITVDADADCQASVAAADFDGGSTDPDDDLLTYSVSPTGPYNLGETNVTLSVSDGEFTETCTATITVVDNSRPIINCPTNISVANDLGNCSAVVFYNVTATDNCPAVTVVNVPASGSVFSVGTTTVNSTATDENGNKSSCRFTVTVKDTENPTLVCKDYQTKLGAGGNIMISPGDVIDILSDNCGIDPTTVDVFPNNFSASGQFTVLVTAKDNNGNPASCKAIVTVEKRPTTLINTGVFIGSYTETVTLSSRLTDDLNGDSPIVGKTVTFNLGTYNATAVTNADGVASTNVTLDQIPGNYTFSTSFDEDSIFMGSNDSDPFTITRATTSVTNLGVYMGQYSDQVTVEARLNNTVNGSPIEGETIFFDIGGVTNSGITNAAGVASVPLILDLDPAQVYNVVASYEGSSLYLSSSDTDEFDVTQEDAIADYTGLMLQAVAPKSISADLLVSFNIQDISCTDFSDPFPGDIRNATVEIFIDNILVKTFDNTDGDNTNDIELVTPGDSKTGAISFINTFSLSGSSSSESFTVKAVIDGYYTGSTETVITIYEPVGDFITGGGYILPDESAGEYASTSGLKTNFGFNVKYNKKGTKLKGHMNIIFRRLEADGIHIYQIKGNAIQSLGVDVSDEDAKIAQFITKANLKDITDPSNEISLGGNLILKVDITDRGEPGSEDSIGINLADGGVLLYSSNWTGISTDELKLSGGNLLIHSGFSSSSSTIKPQGPSKSNKKISNVDNIFEIKVDNNPFNVFAIVSLKTLVHSVDVNYTVYDLNNRVLLQRTLKTTEQFQFGENLASGIYLVQVVQGTSSGIIRLIKR